MSYCAYYPAMQYSGLHQVSYAVAYYSSCTDEPNCVRRTPFVSLSGWCKRNSDHVTSFELDELFSFKDRLLQVAVYMYAISGGRSLFLFLTTKWCSRK